MYVLLSECGTCGLDYTSVNPNIYSFLGLSLVFNMLVPLGIMCFCFGQTLLSGPMHVNPVSPGDILLAKIFATAAVLTLICDLPSLIINIMFATGHVMTHSVVIATTLIGHCRNVTMVAASAACRRGVKDVCSTSCCSDPESPRISQNSRSSLVSMHTMGQSQSVSSLKKYQTFQETSLVTTEGSNGNVANV